MKGMYELGRFCWGGRKVALKKAGAPHEGSKPTGRPSTNTRAALGIYLPRLTALQGRGRWIDVYHFYCSFVFPFFFTNKPFHSLLRIRSAILLLPTSLVLTSILVNRSHLPLRSPHYGLDVVSRF